MTPLTLKYSGTEKWLGPAAGSAPGWGYSYAVMHLRSQAASTFAITAGGADPAGAHETPIPNWGLVTIYKDRSWSGSAFTGGTIIFQGRRTDFNGRAQPEARDTSMVFSDPWYDLEQIIYQHYWQYRAVGSGANATQYFSRLNLFQDISAGPGSSWTYLTTQAQIQQIVNYAAAATPAANIQIGTVDPAYNVPIYGVKGITCAEALQICLKVCPDCVTFFDYTTSPPTLHIRQRGSLGGLTLPFAGTDAHARRHKSSRIRPRYDLIPDKVVTDYQITNRVDNTSYVNFASYAYPAGTDRGLGCLVIPLDITGAVKTNVTGSVTAEAIDPTTTAFWTHARRKPDLDASLHPEISSLAIIDSTINGGANPQGITVLDALTGSPVTLASYPNEITKGAVASWMYAGSTNIVAKEVIITAHLSYVKKDKRNGATALPLLTPADHVVTYHCRITNSAVGTVNYSALLHSDPGEPVITDLAQNLYNAVATLQWEGEHVIVEDSLYSIVTPGNVLNLSGGNSDWATMNAQIYEVEIEFFHGKTTVHFGPHKHLSAGQFFEYLTFMRTRFLYDNPNLRNTGQAGNDSTVALDTDAPAPNTNHGQPIPALFGTLGAPDGSNNQIGIYHDAANTLGNGQFFLGKMLSSGTLDTATPAVKIKLADLSGSDVAKFQTIGPDKFLATGASTLCRWLGTYAGGTTYYPGDIVILSTGTSPGIYIQSYSGSCSGQTPKFPYSGTQYWTVIAFLPYDWATCIGGTAKTSHINSTPPA